MICAVTKLKTTFFFNFQATSVLRCKLKSVVGRITTHLKHCHATKFCCCKLKQHVAASWTGVYFFQNIFIFSTCNNKLCCVTMLEVIRATTLLNLQCNNVALQVAAICCSYYFTLSVLFDFGFGIRNQREKGYYDNLLF